MSRAYIDHKEERFQNIIYNNGKVGCRALLNAEGDIKNVISF